MRLKVAFNSFFKISMLGAIFRFSDCRSSRCLRPSCSGPSPPRRWWRPHTRSGPPAEGPRSPHPLPRQLEFCYSVTSFCFASPPPQEVVTTRESVRGVWEGLRGPVQPKLFPVVPSKCSDKKCWGSLGDFQGSWPTEVTPRLSVVRVGKRCQVTTTRGR